MNRLYQSRQLIALLRQNQSNHQIKLVKYDTRNVKFSSSASLRANDEEQTPHFSSLIEQLETKYKFENFKQGESVNVITKLAKEVKDKSATEAYRNEVLNFAKILSKSDVSGNDNVVLQNTFRHLTGSNLHGLNAKSLIITLNNLHTLNIPISSYLVQSVQNALLWKCRSSQPNQFGLILSYANQTRNQSELCEKIFNEIIRTIEMRWVEIIDPMIILNLIYRSEHFSDTLLAKLEDQLTSDAETYPTDTLIAILKGLAVKGKRPVALIKALTYHLTRRKDLADLKLASDALYSASRMSIKDPELIEALCSNAETALKQSDVTTPIVSVVRSIVNSIGQLGMYHKGLLDGISKWYEQRIKDGVELDQRDLTSFLMTTATLNYCPIDSDKVYEVILNEVTQKSVPNDFIWLNTVWALAVLRKVQHHHFESILSPFFTENFQTELDVQHEGSVIKMLYINAVAKHLYKDYHGSLLSDATLKKWTSNKNLQTSPARASLTASIFEAFHSLASPPNFLLKDINTQMGFQLDAEAVFEVDSAKPLGPIQEMALLGKDDSSPTKNVPAGAKRVAVMILGFNDGVFDVSQNNARFELNGSRSLQKALLEALGYNVMLIKYNELTGKQKLQSVKHLESQLRSVLK